jgi:hypothetical protein
MADTGPRPATSRRDAQGQQPEYHDRDGVGVSKGKVSARQATKDRPVAMVLGLSVVLAVIAGVIVYFMFAAGTPNLK